MPFTLKITRMNNETGEVFSGDETQDHGWKSKEDFLKSLSKYRGMDGHRLLENGYEYDHPSVGAIIKVEAVA